MRSDREPLFRLSSVVAPLLRDNVDTDAIIPATYLRSLATDPATGLFARWRYRSDGTEDPAFILNDPRFRDARVLLTGANFGCGSSRENAVWALQRFGIRCVIALGYGDIFQENCFKNGVLPIAVRAGDHAQLVCNSTARIAYTVTIDVEAGIIIDQDGDVFLFDLDERKRTLLTSGIDEIGSTLESSARIDAFRAGHRRGKPWLYDDAASGSEWNGR